MLGQRHFLPVAVLLLALAACQRLDRNALAPDQERGLARGRDYAAQLIQQGHESADLPADAAIVLGYLERLRLGLGSPFRLIDYALHDPRLPDETRRHLGWALLARTLDGAAYQLDARALDRVRVSGVPLHARAGEHHLELVRNAIHESRDPRSGELAVRLAYALAAAERSIAQRGPVIVAQATALLRDRELARGDALELLRAAGEAGMDPLALLVQWRADRRFAVERPLMQPLAAESERAAIELAPRLALAVRALGPRLALSRAPQPTDDDGAAPRAVPAPLLGSHAALQLGRVVDSLNAPPQTPIALAVDVQRTELLQRVAGSKRGEAAAQRFLERARNEEQLAAEYARLHYSGVGSTAAAAAVLSAAAGMRSYAQEPVWFPGFGGPTTRELADRFSLGSVQFDGSVPAEWRPYYRRMLASALTDLQRVLPSLGLRGMHVRFGKGGGRAATLALHEPRTRTIYLPPATSAGTIAHEVAHDLDWQVALRRFRVRGDYGTDRAVRREGGPLAARLRGLTGASLQPPIAGAGQDHARRPAEVFARSVDWFVTVALAREGRVNGYLSSVQDDILTGYGTVTPPDVTGGAGKALVEILDVVAPVYAGTREWFLKSYGPGRELTAYDLLRRVLETDPAAVAPSDEAWLAAVGNGLEPRDVSVRFAGVRRAQRAAEAAIDAWVCSPGAAYERAAESARRQLVAEAAGARARGLALELADDLAGEAGRQWLARELYGTPWPGAEVDAALTPVLAQLAEQSRSLERMGATGAPRGFRLAAAPSHCSTRLF